MKIKGRELQLDGLVRDWARRLGFAGCSVPRWCL